MRVKCTECHQRATIRSSRDMSDSIRDLYCVCQNPQCGHTFVMQLSFLHTLSPSALVLPETVRHDMQHKSRRQLLSLFEGLG